jgi:hypothetical protein
MRCKMLPTVTGRARGWRFFSKKYPFSMKLSIAEINFCFDFAVSGNCSNTFFKKAATLSIRLEFKSLKFAKNALPM